MSIAVSFLQAMDGFSKNSATACKSYIYCNGHEYKTFEKKKNQTGYKKIAIGLLTKSASSLLKQYSKQEVEVLKASLSKVQTSLNDTRKGNVLKKVWIVFLSALANLFKGFGCVDSLTLVNRTLKKLNATIGQQSVNLTGQIELDKNRLPLIEKIFSSNDTHSGTKLIGGEQVSVTSLSTMKPILRIDAFPGIVFKSDRKSEDVRARYHAMEKAKILCAEFHLDKLIVPEASLLTIPNSKGDQLVIAEKEYPLVHGLLAQSKLFDKYEQELGDIVEQLTILICKTGFSDVKWDNIPIISVDGSLKVVLIDLEPHQGKTVKDGLVGWENSRNGWGHPTPGLISCCPQYVDRILATAKKYLTSEEFEAIRPELEAAKEKAQLINTRRSEIDAFHKKNGVTLQSKAIPLERIDLSALDPEGKCPHWNEIIADINAVIAKQMEEHPHLAHSREWRLTSDAYTADSNFNETIPNSYFLIKKTLVPFLKTTGIAHSWLDGKEATAFDIDLRRRVGDSDLVVQF